MLNKRALLSFFLFLSIFVFASSLYAAKKTIYIKPFAILKGIPAADPIGTHFKDYLSEYIIEQGGYSIITDDEVKQVIEQESLKMTLDACYDDSCIKKLMQSIKTDYVIYGTVSKIENLYYVTSKILDRTSGTIILSRVKTVEFTNRRIVSSAAKAVGEYLLTGDDDAIKNIDDIDKSSFQAQGSRGNIVNRYPLLRIGLGCSLYYPDVEEYFDRDQDMPLSFINALSIDLFLFRYRFSESTGFDFFTRFMRKEYSRNDITPAEAVSKYGFESNEKVNENRFILMCGHAGIRYITGTYFANTQWQVYFSLAYQYINVDRKVSYNISPGSTEVSNIETYTSHGIVAGAGFEIAFLPYTGLFVEMDYGYNKAEIVNGEGNVDGLILLAGLTFRTGQLW